MTPSVEILWRFLYFEAQVLVAKLPFGFSTESL